MGFVDRFRVNQGREGSRVYFAAINFGFSTGKLANTDVGGVRAALRTRAAIQSLYKL
jgi:hypothetical protein